MTTTVATISLSEAAYMLRQALGPLRNWASFLTDNIRHKQSVHGLTLEPCARQHDGKAYRPVYGVEDVLTFIEAVKKAISTAGKTPIIVTPLAMDRRRPWRVNKFDQQGKPALRRIGSIVKAAHH